MNKWTSNYRYKDWSLHIAGTNGEWDAPDSSSDVDHRWRSPGGAAGGGEGSTTAGSWDDDHASCSSGDASDTCCSCSESSCLYADTAEVMAQQTQVSSALECIIFSVFR